LKKTQKIRRLVQILFLFFVIYLSVGHYLEEEGIMNLPGIASLHAICPFGGIVNLYTFISSGDYVQKLHQSDFIMLFALLGVLVFTGKSFCGWICPLGSVQEWTGMLGKKIFKKRYNKVPVKIDKYLRYLKYLILIWVLVQTARTSELVFKDFDPYFNLFNIWTDEIALSGYIVVFLTLGLSLFIERPFCRYACPLGAINGFFNKFSILNIKRNKNTCINCKKCDQVCPAGIVVSKADTITNSECIRCLKCVDSCPVNNEKENTLKIKPFFARADKNKKIVKNWIYISVIVLIFLGTIGISIGNELFITERIKTYKSTNDIRGSSTINDITKNYNVNREILAYGFNISEELSDEIKIKDLAEIMGLDEELEIISPEPIRLIVDNLDTNISLFLSELEIESDYAEEAMGIKIQDDISLKEIILQSKRGSIAFLLSGYWPELEESGIISEPEIKENDNDEEEIEIKGNTTLKELRELIGDYEGFLVHFSLPVDLSESTQLRVIRDDYNVEMSEIREYINNNSN